MLSTVHYATFLAIILLLQSCSAAANFTIPFFSPFLGDNACKENVCGKGSCVASNNSTFGFECQCEHGWKQARPQDDDFLMFLPCVVPNSCFWTSCGGGSCNKTSLFTHNCECDEGYYNLLNSTAFPCYKDCAIGTDCASLGLNIGNPSTLSPPTTASSADNSNHGVIPSVEFGWLITIITTLALVLFKLEV